MASYSNSFTSVDQNTVSRFRSVFLKSVQDNVIFPKFVLVVPDDDLICYFNRNPDIGLKKSMARLLNNIMTEHTRLVLAQKDYLPPKSKKANYPQIIWIQPPEHDNFTNNDLRRKFNECLNDIVQFHNNTITLPMKKVWDPSNRNLYIKKYGRFTAEGFSTYWKVVDCTLWYADTILWNKAISPKKLKRTFIPQKQDKYRWTSPKFNHGQYDRDREGHHEGNRHRGLPTTDHFGNKLSNPF